MIKNDVFACWIACTEKVYCNQRAPNWKVERAKISSSFPDDPVLNSLNLRHHQNQKPYFNITVLGKLGPGQSGLDNRARTTAPRTVRPPVPFIRGPTVRPEKVANWAPDSKLMTMPNNFRHNFFLPRCFLISFHFWISSNR